MVLKIANYDDLIDSLNYIHNKKELETIKKAYDYAFLKHFGVKRLTGEDYIEHPVNVAYILAGLKADYCTICAGLMHDVLEDCDVTEKELSETFGPEIAFLVNGVTKINKLNFDSGNAAIIASQRKILVGLCSDVRVIFVKLADRLHNMRTLWVLSEEKQKQKAKETLEILTPIAHRLGMSKIKSELEDLSLRYYKPNVYFDIVEKLNNTKQQRDNDVLKMGECLSSLLNENKLTHSSHGRAKSIYSIFKKLDKGKRFEQIYDLLALRIYVDTPEDCYKALGIIHGKYKPVPGRFKDYIANPKTNMYQSIHTTVFGYNDFMYEVQIRTYEMDAIAEGGIASHWSYKEGKKAGLQNQMEQKLQFFRSIIELGDDLTDEDFMSSVTEEFNDTIYVYTPRGDVIELSNGSTPIDFAYKVHSKVGDHVVGAIVNNKIAPLTYELKSNDVIKINTSNTATPSREWINIAHTQQAKAKIRSYFKKIDKVEYLKLGEEKLLKALKKKKINANKFLLEENINKLIKEFKCRDLSELYCYIGSDKINISSIINFYTGDNDTKKDIIMRKTLNNEVVLPQVKTDIIVSGIDNVKVNIASCCKPIVGDDIIGYITKGNGISVHRTNCPNVSETEDRVIDVKWNDIIEKKYPTNIIVETLKTNSMLLSIISKTSSNNVSIQSVDSYDKLEEETFILTVLTENVEFLKKFMSDIRGIDNVLKVERLIN